MKEYLKESFTNEFGEVIEPGDRVIAITMGYSGSISRYEGVYLGKRVYTNYRKEPQYQTIVQVTEKVSAKWTPEGKKMGWYHPDYRDTKYETRMQTRITTLHNNYIYKRP